MHKFLKELRKYKEKIPRNTLKTIRGQALSGDIEGARKGLEKALEKEKNI